MRRHFAQFLVDEREQFLGSLDIAAFQGMQDASDLGHEQTILARNGRGKFEGAKVRRSAARLLLEREDVQNARPGLNTAAPNGSSRDWSKGLSENRKKV